MDQAESSASGDAFHQLRIASRFIEMALYRYRFIYSRFTMSFYKRMLGKKLIMKDIEGIDPEFYNSLVWIKENDIDDFRLELKKNEDKERVTEENKEEYLTLMTDWRMTRGIDLQTQAYLDSFNEVVPIELLKYFYERDKIGKYIPFIGITLETINKLHGFGSSSSSLTMKNEPVPMLQFVIGTCRVPVGGFSELMGSNEPHSIYIEKFGK